MIRTTISGLALTALLAAGSAQADHNSPFGEGWALMPTDNHDEAVERTTDLRSDQAAAGDMGADMGSQVDDMENIRQGMTDEVRGAMQDAAEARGEMQDATEARGEMSDMASDMRGAGMGR
jgi:hypothetical protein